jgi:hypothetical protein
MGAPDASLTPTAGLFSVTELVGRLGMIEAIDMAVGPIKARARGFGCPGSSPSRGTGRKDVISGQ